MRDRDLRHLSDLVRGLADQNVTLTRSDGVAMLILLRDSAPKSSMLRDLGHSVAHDARDRGVSFDYLEKFSLHIRRLFIHGGRLVTPMMFPIETIINEVNAVMRRFGCAEALAHDLRTRYVLAALIADVLHGTSYKLRVATASLTVGRDANGHPDFGALIRFTHDIEGVVPVNAGRSGGLVFPWLLGEDDIQAHHREQNAQR